MLTEKTEKTEKTKQENEEDSTKKANFQQAVWPWESVCNKLKSAFTEICVLSDAISIAKDKRYMVLDPVHQDTPEQRQLVHLFSKKRVNNFWLNQEYLYLLNLLGPNICCQHSSKWWRALKTGTF